MEQYGEIIMSIEDNDWRLQGQEKYLVGMHFTKKKFPLQTGDHRHCEFCWQKIGVGKDAITDGFESTDRKRWVCEKCFNDFKGMFGFVLDE